MSSEEKLAEVLLRLQKVNAQVSGRPSEIPSSGVDLETLISGIEKVTDSLSQNLNSSTGTTRLAAVLGRLQNLDSKLSGASAAPSNTGDLADLVNGVETVSESLSRTFGQGDIAATKSTAAVISNPVKSISSVTETAAAPAAVSNPTTTPATTQTTSSTAAAAPSETSQPTTAHTSTELPSSAPAPTETSSASSAHGPPPSSPANEEKKEEPSEGEFSTFRQAEDHPLQSGELNKLGGGLFKKWQGRKFRLFSDRLEWTEGDETQIRNQILMSDVISFQIVEEKKYKKKFVFELVTRKKTYVLEASENTFNNWVSNFEKFNFEKHQKQ